MKSKKIYKKPEITAVKLKVEEAVLAACKGATGTNNKAGRCRSAVACTNRLTGS